ncbi:MAG: twin-arginine translocation signal domain-containing protein [Myxococcota bacterium]
MSLRHLSPHPRRHPPRAGQGGGLAMSRLGTITRRTFLVGTAAVGGAAIFGTYSVARPHDNPVEVDLPDGAVAFNPWVRIDGCASSWASKARSVRVPSRTPSV